MHMEVEVPQHLLESWQDIVDLLSEIADVPAALIMRVDEDAVNVFRTSDSKGNPYLLGAVEKYYSNCGLFCEYVMRTNSKLCVPDALSDPEWMDSPDVHVGMVSYLGFPILYPDSSLFGTICVLDNKPNAYDSKIERLMVHFKNLIESHLAQLCKFRVLKSSLSIPRDGSGAALRTPKLDVDGMQSQILNLAKTLTSTNEKLRGEIVERKIAEKELLKTRYYISSIIDLMPSRLVGVDAEGKITLWNREAERASGISRADAVGQSVSSFGCLLSDISENIQDVISSGISHNIGRMTHICRGERRVDEVMIFPLDDLGVEGAVVRVDNVTERVRLERMMVQSEKMMSVAGLAAGIAHEINNPLTAIMNSVQNVKRRVLEDLPQNRKVADECDVPLERIRTYFKQRGVQEMLAEIHESGARASSIVRNMLDFSRNSELNFKKHSIAEILDKSIEIAALDSGFRKIEFLQEYDPDTPKVYCEATEIQQVFLNLLKNGAEAMAEKDYCEDFPQFTLQIRSVQGMVVVEITDNGPGMSETIRKRVLEPFFTTKEVGKGTGLGLSVSYYIWVDQHGGTFEVESELGNWTRFILKIPAAS